MIVVFGSINLDLIFSLSAIPRAGETLLGPRVRIEPGRQRRQPGGRRGARRRLGG